MNSIHQNKFFVLGCQRSGTTLLGMTLQAHSGIEFVEESESRFHEPYCLSKRINLEKVAEHESQYQKLIGFKSPRDTHRFREISKAISGVKIVWISRHVYQVTASMLAPLIKGGQCWAVQHAQDEIIKYLYEGNHDPVLAGQFRQVLTRKDARQRLVGLASICWIAKSKCEREASDHPEVCLFSVKYDDLALRPEQTLAGVLRFLGLPWDSSVLRHTELVSGVRPGGTATDRSIDAKSLQKWKEQLSEADIELIDELVVEHADVLSSTSIQAS